MDAALSHYSTSPLSGPEKTLFAFVEKVNRSSPDITQQDVEHLHSAGWSDEAIYDAINVCALFNFYNRWVDAAGVHEMPAEAHEASGKRLARRGYILKPPVLS